MSAIAVDNSSPETSNISFGHYLLTATSLFSALLNGAMLAALALDQKHRIKECARFVQLITIVYCASGCSELPILAYTFVVRNNNCAISAMYLTGGMRIALFRVMITLELCMAVDRAVAITMPLRHMKLDGDKIAFRCLFFALLLGALDLGLLVTGKSWSDVAVSCLNGNAMSVLYHTLMHQAADTLTYILLSIADITFCVGIRKWSKSATADARRSNSAILLVLLLSNLILGSSIVAAVVFTSLPQEYIDKMISIPSLLGHVNEVATFFIYASRHPAVRGSFLDLKKRVFDRISKISVNVGAV